MLELYGFNPRKCNSASTLSGCVERKMSKVIIALPTSNESVGIFEQTITGSFNSVNTCLAFDTEILLPNSLENTDSEEVDNQDNSDDVRKDYKYKICYKLKLDNEVTYLKRYYHYFDQKVSKFVTTDLIKQEIDEKYNDSLMKLSKDDKFYEIKLSSIKAERAESMETAEKYEQTKNNKKKNFI